MRNSNYLKFVLALQYFLYSVCVLPIYLAISSSQALKDLGGIALNLLFITLLISPFIKIFPNLKLAHLLLNIRPQLGILMGVFGLSHGLGILYHGSELKTALSNMSFLEVWQNMPYIALGLLAAVILIPLLLTSNKYIKNKMGANWYKLHKLTYVVFALAIVHGTFIRSGEFSWSGLASASPLLVTYFVVLSIAKYKTTRGE